MATFADMAGDNPDLRLQYDIWRDELSQKGEDSTDWEVFRRHIMDLGAPDPGPTPPADFVGEDWKAEHPEWVERYRGAA